MKSSGRLLDLCLSEIILFVDAEIKKGSYRAERKLEGVYLDYWSLGVEELPFEEQLSAERMLFAFSLWQWHAEGVPAFHTEEHVLHPLLTTASIISYLEKIKVKK